MKDVLKKIGFDKFEVEIYDFLVKNGSQKPSYIAKILDFKRPTVYKALYSLEDSQLVKRADENAESELSFQAQNPRFIQYLIEKERNKSEVILKNYLTEFPAYVDIFLKQNITPILDVFYGVVGLRRIDNEVEDLNSEVLLIRSAIDRDLKDLREEIDRHVLKRSELGIPFRIISPIVETTKYTLRDYDKFKYRENMRIKLVDKTVLSLDTQIMLYSGKVAITNYKGQIVTLRIQQPDIYQSFKGLFEFMWDDVRISDIKSMMEK